MTGWWWVRHGPTHAKGFVGRTDLPADLSDKAALARLAAYLPERALVVSSDLVRASATADAITSTRHRLANRPALREMDFGDWETREFRDIAKTDPDLARAFWTDPATATPPNGESWQQVATRVERATLEIMAAHPTRDIIAVAHVGVIITQLQRAGKMTSVSAMSFTIDNLSVTRLEFLNPDWRIRGVNYLA
ncbi:MAG: histidine phosphatase family protein [Alphaproteobacteria bacterium]|nr:histidine phosphatase family protein [Alphaproteobacteria bacterium]